jgi:hypothetical protein
LELGWDLELTLGIYETPNATVRDGSKTFREWQGIIKTGRNLPIAVSIDISVLTNLDVVFARQTFIVLHPPVGLLCWQGGA